MSLFHFTEELTPGEQELLRIVKGWIGEVLGEYSPWRWTWRKDICRVAVEIKLDWPPVVSYFDGRGFHSMEGWSVVRVCLSPDRWWNAQAILEAVVLDAVRRDEALERGDIVRCDHRVHVEVRP